MSSTTQANVACIFIISLIPTICFWIYIYKFLLFTHHFLVSSVTHPLCLRSGYDITIDNTLHHETKQHWRKHVKNTLNRYISFSFKAIFATGVENINFSIHRQPETKVTEWFEANLRQPFLPIYLSIGNNCRQSTERHTALPQKIHIQLSINPSVVGAGLSQEIQVSTMLLMLYDAFRCQVICSHGLYQS